MKKNKEIIVSIAIIILVIIIATLIIKNSKNDVTNIIQEPKTESEIKADLNKTISSDTTTAIDESLKNIDLSDTSTSDLNSIDQDLQNL